MIVNRRTFSIKRPRMQETVDWLRARWKEFNHPHAIRVYTPNIASFDILTFEIEFESLAGYEKFWADFSARPETAEFMSKWYELTEGGGTNEIWTLEE